MFSSKKTMWSDGHFSPHAWDKYGFNEYQLKHCCFGSDGDEQGEATTDPVEETRNVGGWVNPDTEIYDESSGKTVDVDPALGGDADDFYEDDSPVTPSDWSGFQEAYEDTTPHTRSPHLTDRQEALRSFGRSGPMTDAEIGRAMGEARATSATTNPYTDVIRAGIIADPRKATGITGWIDPDTGKYAGNPGLMPSEMGFVPQFGYDVFGTDDSDEEADYLGDYINPTKYNDFDYTPRSYGPKGASYTPYDPSAISQGKLGQSYVDAYQGSKDLGSDIAGLFGFQSPVEFDSSKGFYEGTTFDPFDAPVLSLLAGLNPVTGALYGLTKGLVKGDPVGGALSLIGPYSSLAPAVRAAGGLKDAYNIWTGGDTTFSNLVGAGTPAWDASFNIPGYTSTDMKFDPGGYLSGLGQDLKGGLQGLFSDPTAGKATYDLNALPSTPQLSPQQLEGLGLGAQQAVKDAMLAIGRQERNRAVLERN